MQGDCEPIGRLTKARARLTEDRESMRSISAILSEEVRPLRHEIAALAEKKRREWQARGPDPTPG